MNKSEKIKKEYESLKNELLKTNLAMDELLTDEKVRRFAELTEKKNKFQKQFELISLEYECLKMRECGHIFVIGSKTKEWDGPHRIETTESHYCIKCGLDSRCQDHSFQELNPIEKEMSSIYEETARNGILINCVCHPELANEIYKRIKTENPNISDKDLIERFKQIHQTESKHLKLTNNK